MQTGTTERLWTPWRMNYVGGGTKETGCIFCNRLQRSNDIESLILYRAQNTFVIMNLFPYNTGHIMLVPNEHVSDPAGLTLGALAEMGTTLPALTNALRKAFACHGFNIGLNIGAIAGAGVEAHLHQHIVPRWQGDANFMPIIASTMTIPELIPVTYAKVRAELTREITGATTARFVLLDAVGHSVLLREGAVPEAMLHPDIPVLQSVVQSLPSDVTDVQLTGWAGPDNAAAPQDGDIVLTLAGTVGTALPAGWERISIKDLDPGGEVAKSVHRAISQRAPAR